MEFKIITKLQKKYSRKIVLHKHLFMSKELQKYNNIDVTVNVIKDYGRNIFHVLFPCGFRTDAKGENQGKIVCLDASSGNYVVNWSEYKENSSN